MNKIKSLGTPGVFVPLWLIILLLAPAACTPSPPAATPTASPVPTATVEPTPTATAEPTPTTAMGPIIPLPVSVAATGGTFTLSPTAGVAVWPATAELLDVGHYLADRLNPATGYGMQVRAAEGPAEGGIYLTTDGADPALGEEGYELAVTPDGVTLVAPRPAGLFRGVQTIRQLLPPAIESPAVQPGPWTMPTGAIRDHPRFAWRGAMLDVARHFFSVDDVKRTIDLMAYYKMNRFHLHLTDDQGWRIEIKSWPDLTVIGGSTEVGGGPGGYYTQEEYADIVAYAQSRYVVVVPEIDMPGHTGAALASYGELNRDGVARRLRTTTGVGVSSLWVDDEITFAFVDDVIREVAALTPGPYIHVGGDEAIATSDADYVYFVNRVQAIVQSYGKRMVGWEEIAQAELDATSVAQHWNSTLAHAAVEQGAQVIMSPSTRAYLDMKYNATTPLGLSWAGTIEVEKAYTWDPATQLGRVTEDDVLGVEAPLWSETIETMDDVEFMAFPRLIGHAEIGWSPADGRNWEEYRVRLGAHGPRLRAMGVDYYASEQVPWE